MSEIVLPQSLANNRRLDRWLRFDADRKVRLAVGKVEIGQGILTVLAQIAAEELDVPFASVRVLSGDTDNAPDEGTTSSSLSVEVSGASVRLASAEVRQRVVERLAQRLNCAPEEISVEDGSFLRAGEATGHDYWNFVSPEDLAADATGRIRPFNNSFAGFGLTKDDFIPEVKEVIGVASFLNYSEGGDRMFI